MFCKIIAVLNENCNLKTPQGRLYNTNVLNSYKVGLVKMANLINISMSVHYPKKKECHFNIYTGHTLFVPHIF